MEKFKKYATIGLFLLLIFGLLILHIALPDQELSYSERTYGVPCVHFGEIAAN